MTIKGVRFWLMASVGSLLCGEGRGPAYRWLIIIRELYVFLLRRNMPTFFAICQIRDLSHHRPTRL